MHRFYEILLKIHSFFVTLKKRGETVTVDSFRLPGEKKIFGYG